MDFATCDGIDVNPGNADAWCASMIEKEEAASGI
jgi:hypothetical protein